MGTRQTIKHKQATRINIFAAISSLLSSLNRALAGYLGPHSSRDAGVVDSAEPTPAEASAGAGIAAGNQEAAGLTSLEDVAVVGLWSRQGRDGGGQGEDESGGELHVCGLKRWLLAVGCR